MDFAPRKEQTIENLNDGPDRKILVDSENKKWGVFISLAMEHKTSVYYFHGNFDKVDGQWLASQTSYKRVAGYHF